MTVIVKQFNQLKEQDKKFEALCAYIKGLKSYAIAFSGGVDSTLLVAITHVILKEQSMAITVNTPYIPKWEMKEATLFAQKLGVKHHIVTLDIPEVIQDNPTLRCYFCKREVFTKILKTAQDNSIKTVVDGSNYDDLGDFRPGMKALKELNIKSPFLACKVTKKEIRTWSKLLALPTWDKPAYACLLTRIPHHTIITVEDLEQIEMAEKVMFALGIKAVRVRKHDKIARLEVEASSFAKVLKHTKEISDKLIAIGFEYVTLDLSGYKMSGLQHVKRGATDE